MLILEGLEFVASSEVDTSNAIKRFISTKLDEKSGNEIRLCKNCQQDAVVGFDKAVRYKTMMKLCSKS